MALHMSVRPSVCPQTNLVRSITRELIAQGSSNLVDHDQQMTPIKFGVSRSKVNVTVTFKLRGAYMFHKHFLFQSILREEVFVHVILWWSILKTKHIHHDICRNISLFESLGLMSMCYITDQFCQMVLLILNQELNHCLCIT